MALLGSALRDLRTSRKFTQEELAYRMKRFSRTFKADYIRKYENGDTQPSLETYMLLMHVLKSTPGDCFELPKENLIDEV